MKNIAALLLIITTFNLNPETINAQPDYASRVNPFIGTGGHGHTYPGASAPFGMVQLSPDTRLEGWDGCSGYHYSDSLIYGFSHTHLSGTGCSDYGDILLMPVVTDEKFKIFDNQQYRSKFSHANETAAPGYYKVLLDKFNILAELTCTPRTGFHKYTFPKTKNATIIIDLKHRDEVLDSYLIVVNDSTVKGMRRSKAWAEDQYVFFYMVFSKPFTKYNLAQDDQLTQSKQERGKNIKGHFDFDASNGKPIMVKVGISAVSEEGAEKNLLAENPAWNFEKVKSSTRALWNKELGKIEVKGNSKNETVFYTALYHCLLNPNIFSDVDGRYRCNTSSICTVAAEWKTPLKSSAAYTVFSLWDTYRALHPLLTIIDSGRTNDFINTFISRYKNAGILPVWELSAYETFCMIGYHSVPVIADAYMKGIRGFDANLALKAMKHSADTTLYGLQCYRNNGFLANDCEHESVSKTLEYAYDDWCIAQMAKSLGATDDYNRFIRRAQSYKNVFDPSSGFMRGKNNGMFHSPFDPAEVNNYYTEANSWQYSFYVPQDVSGLMALHGGKEKFANKLDALFTASETLKGRQQADITGLMGQYAHGNEPSHHITYLYNYAGQPWKTQKNVNYILNNFYNNTPDGLCGNEDCGQMSAWYVMSSIGFYQVCPASNQYCIGTTVFDEVKIHLENGKTFYITSKNRSDKNYYVAGVKLNGMDLQQSYFMHDALMNGGKLELTMKDVPETTKMIQPPVTLINDNFIVPAPFAVCNGRTFRDKMNVELKSISDVATIFYRLSGADSSEKMYTTPVEINSSCTLSYVARQADGQSSAVITTSFLKIPDNRFIELKANYDPQYTAGGNEALIDQVRGEVDWRKGNWQGYAGDTLEAIVDLGKTQNITQVGLGCLQDIGPWIFYPSEIIFAVSNDKSNYTTIATIRPGAAREAAPVEVKDFTQDVTATGRYIKVIAKPYGKLPQWHVSAGEKAWLFVDEIIVKSN